MVIRCPQCCYAGQYPYFGVYLARTTVRHHNWIEVSYRFVNRIKACQFYYLFQIKDDTENRDAIRLHFSKLDANYPNQTKMVVINFVEELGKESRLGDAYIKHLVDLNKKDLIYVQFDFHLHW